MTTQTARTLEQAIAEEKADRDAMNAQVVCRIKGQDVTRGALEEAFANVAHPMDWKNPIRSTLHETEFDLAAYAVEFFTSTKLVKQLDLGLGMWLVVADGYRAGPAGDH